MAAIRAPFGLISHALGEAGPGSSRSRSSSREAWGHGARVGACSPGVAPPSELGLVCVRQGINVPRGRYLRTPPKKKTTQPHDAGYDVNDRCGGDE